MNMLEFGLKMFRYCIQMLVFVLKVLVLVVPQQGDTGAAAGFHDLQRKQAAFLQRDVRDSVLL